MKLYSYYRSSCSYRVRIALNLKQLDYEIVPVHLVNSGGEQHLPEYVEKNPMAVVPTLEVGDLRVTQSMVIFEYLEQKHPDPSLFGQEPFKIREVCEMINSGIQPIQNLAVLKKLKAEAGYDDEKVAAWIRHWIGKGFTAIEAFLKDSAGDFCIGDQPSAADCFLIPQVYNAKRFSVNMEEFPKLNRINDKCLSLEAFHRASPEQHV